MTRHHSHALHSIHPIHIKPIHMKHVSVKTALGSMEHVSRTISNITHQQLSSAISGVANPLVSAMNNVNPALIIGVLVVAVVILKK